MSTGICKLFRQEEGYGFIKPDDGGPDYFVHETKIVDRADFGLPKKGDLVEFGVSERRGKQQAVNVRRIQSK